MTIKQLKERLKDIKSRGFVGGLRTHDTGVGHTLEQLLGLSENNVAIPDLGKLELKSQRLESQSLITLFTKKPDKLDINLLDKFGYPRESNGKMVLHQTITDSRANKQGYRLLNVNNALAILKDEKCVCSYNKTALEKIFDEKISKGIILVLSTSRKDSQDNEEFNYQEAFLLKEGDFEKFLDNLFYDIRIGRYPDGRPHDHGSAFRVRKSSLPKIFKTYKKLI